MGTFLEESVDEFQKLSLKEFLSPNPEGISGEMNRRNQKPKFLER